MARDMASPEIEARIARSLALRNVFGFRGTPAILVGRTVVEGDIGEATLSRLIEAEREAGSPPTCQRAAMAGQGIGCSGLPFTGLVASGNSSTRMNCVAHAKPRGAAICRKGIAECSCSDDDPVIHRDYLLRTRSPADLADL
jgi:hypothetical protein